VQFRSTPSGKIKFFVNTAPDKILCEYGPWSMWICN